MRGRPAPNRALPGRSRPPSAAVQRRKLFPAPTAKSKLNSLIYKVSALARLRGCAPPAARACFYIYLRLTGGRRNFKTPARRPLLRPPRRSFLLMISSHRAENGEDHKERARPGAPGSRVAVAPGLAPASPDPAHSWYGVLTHPTENYLYSVKRFQRTIMSFPALPAPGKLRLYEKILRSRPLASAEAEDHP